MDILGPICKYCIVNKKKPSEKLGIAMWVLQGGNFAKCSLMIMDVGIA
jgi:hypothetical protein